MHLGSAVGRGHDTERYTKERPIYRALRKKRENRPGVIKQGMTLISIVSNPLENSQGRHKAVTRTISELNLNTIMFRPWGNDK